MDSCIREQIQLMIRYADCHKELDRELALEQWVLKYGKLFREQYEHRGVNNDCKSED